MQTGEFVVFGKYQTPLVVNQLSYKYIGNIVIKQAK